MNDKNFQRAWRFSGFLTICGIPALSLVLSGFKLWSIIFSSVWVPMSALSLWSIEKDIANDKSEIVVIRRPRDPNNN